VLVVLVVLVLVVLLVVEVSVDEVVVEVEVSVDDVVVVVPWMVVVVVPDGMLDRRATKRLPLRLANIVMSLWVSTSSPKVRVSVTRVSKRSGRFMRAARTTSR
jgi:hypothetical protein